MTRRVTTPLLTNPYCLSLVYWAVVLTTGAVRPDWPAEPALCVVNWGAVLLLGLLATLPLDRRPTVVRTAPGAALSLGGMAAACAGAAPGMAIAGSVLMLGALLDGIERIEREDADARVACDTRLLIAGGWTALAGVALTWLR